MSVLEKIDNFLAEDNKSAARAAAAKIKAKSRKGLSQIIKEQDEEYADGLFGKMADFINKVDISDLPDEMVLLRNEIIGELYPGEDDPFDDDDFTGDDIEDVDAEDVAADDFDADFGDEAEEPEEVEDYFESKKLRTLLKGK